METLRSPGSFNDFSEGLPEEVSHERAFQLYGVCLELHRRELVEQLGTTEEQLHDFRAEEQAHPEGTSDSDS